MVEGALVISENIKTLVKKYEGLFLSAKSMETTGATEEMRKNLARAGKSFLKDLYKDKMPETNSTIAALLIDLGSALKTKHHEQLKKIGEVEKRLAESNDQAGLEELKEKTKSAAPLRKRAFDAGQDIISEGLADDHLGSLITLLKGNKGSLSAVRELQNFASQADTETIEQLSGQHRLKEIKGPVAIKNLAERLEKAESPREKEKLREQLAEAMKISQMVAYRKNKEGLSEPAVEEKPIVKGKELESPAGVKKRKADEALKKASYEEAGREMKEKFHLTTAEERKAAVLKAREELLKDAGPRFGRKMPEKPAVKAEETATKPEKKGLWKKLRGYFRKDQDKAA